MKKITRDVDTLTLKEKEKILRELNQDELIELFKDSYRVYKPVEPKKLALDQQLAITITEDEKQYLRKELVSIKHTGTSVTVSSYIRNKVLTQIDIGLWNEKALEGLQKLSKGDYDEKALLKKKNKLLRMIDNLADPDNEDELTEETLKLYRKQLKDTEERLKETKKSTPRRQYRLSGRTTFNEANTVRWRAARLSLSLADYVRFVIFEYEPNTFADEHLSINARKRFYVSILDVYRNGWGEPPVINECPNCARLQADIQALKEQLERYKALEKSRRF